jgi:hypothetical protein
MSISSSESNAFAMLSAFYTSDLQPGYDLLKAALLLQSRIPIIVRYISSQSTAEYIFGLVKL